MEVAITHFNVILWRKSYCSIDISTWELTSGFIEFDNYITGLQMWVPVYHPLEKCCSLSHNLHNFYIRPLQINSLFPVHRPHLVTASSKYSIIPYSSIIFQLFLHTDRLSKSYLETVSGYLETVSAVLSSQHKLHVCVIFATYKGRNKLKHVFMQPLWQCQANNGLKS